MLSVRMHELRCNRLLFTDVVWLRTEPELVTRPANFGRVGAVSHIGHRSSRLDTNLL